jgi:hypothetical protein
VRRRRGVVGLVGVRGRSRVERSVVVVVVVLVGRRVEGLRQR